MFRNSTQSMLSLIMFAVTLVGSATARPQRSLTNQGGINASVRQSSHSLVEAAYDKKQISLDERILYHACSFFDPGKLPAAYQSREPEYCGTWAMLEIARNWDLLTPETRNILTANYGFREHGGRNRPTGLDSTRNTVHFKIHYTVNPSDTNAISSSDYNHNGTPDYVDLLMQYAEESWNHEIVTKGYYRPPDDNNGGGDNRTDIYLMKIVDFGVCEGDFPVGNNPNSPFNETNAWAGYILMRNHFQNQPWSEDVLLSDVIAHEFFHSIQYGYDAWEDGWMMEATASWMEDEVFDNNVNLSWLDSWFQMPWVPLDATTAECFNHWYGSWIFFRHLSELLKSPDIVKSIWEKAIIFVDSVNVHKYKSIQAIEAALNLAGWTFRDAFRSFTQANFKPGGFYSEGDLYPAIQESGFATGDFIVSDSVKRRASRYYFVSPNVVPKGTDAIDFVFTPKDPLTKFDVQVIAVKDTNSVAYIFQNTFTLTPTEDLNAIAVVVMNYDTTGTHNKFELEIHTHSRMYLLSHRDVISGPNTAMGRVTWYEHGAKTGFYFDGRQVHRVGDLADLVNQAPAIDSGSIAFPLKFNKHLTPDDSDGLGFFTDTDSNYCWSTDWNFMNAIDQHEVPEILMDKGRIMFVKRFVKSGKYAVARTDSCKKSVNITDSLTYQPSLHNFHNGHLIWQKGYRYTGDVYWYNGLQNVLPPSQHRLTVPKVHNGQLAWLESYGNTYPGADSTWELYFFNGTTTTRITNDHVTDGKRLSYSRPVFDLKNGKIAWMRSVMVNWSLTPSERTFTHLYENGKIVKLYDTVSQAPDCLSGIRIDERKGYVVWAGSLPDGSKNLYLYNGKRIIPLLSYSIANELDIYQINIDDGKIAFRAFGALRPYLGICAYLYEYDSTFTAIEEKPTEQSGKSLLNCYPNPFTSGINISFDLPGESHVTVKVFNSLGEDLQTLADEHLDKGRHQRCWSSSGMPNGVYFIQLYAGDIMQTEKIVLIR